MILSAEHVRHERHRRAIAVDAVVSPVDVLTPDVAILRPMLTAKLQRRRKTKLGKAAPHIQAKGLELVHRVTRGRVRCVQIVTGRIRVIDGVPRVIVDFDHLRADAVDFAERDSDRHAARHAELPEVAGVDAQVTAISTRLAGERLDAPDAVIVAIRKIAACRRQHRMNRGRSAPGKGASSRGAVRIVRPVAERHSARGRGRAIGPRVDREVDGDTLRLIVAPLPPDAENTVLSDAPVGLDAERIPGNYAGRIEHPIALQVRR